jgi:hypothetical protein
VAEKGVYSLEKRPDLASAWISKIKQNPAIAAIVVGATVLGGIASFIGNISTLREAIVEAPKSEVALPNRQVPSGNPSSGAHSPATLDSAPISKKVSARIIAFTLSPSAIGYEETRTILFGASGTTYRTFQPRYPWRKLPVPVFLITIRNPSQEDVVLTSVRYQVAQVGQVKGGTEGPLKALATYRHTIEWKVGDQVQSLIPPFNIPAGQSASFEIQISTKNPEPGLGWLMKIVIGGTDGELSTDYFQLYLPKSMTESKNVSIDKITEDGFKSKAQTPILQRSAEISLSDFDQSESSCYFQRAGVSNKVRNLDALDRDMLILRAGFQNIDQFLSTKTETNPPITYRYLLGEAGSRNLLMLVKTHVSCRRP